MISANVHMEKKKLLILAYTSHNSEWPVRQMHFINMKKGLACFHFHFIFKYFSCLCFLLWFDCLWYVDQSEAVT